MGLNGALFIARFMDWPISENQVDAIKEGILKCCERKIEDSPLSLYEKEEQKRRMKCSADAYNNGMKNGLRMVGRIK